MFDIFSKILNVKELRGKLLATLGLLIVFRAGIFIPVPGVNPQSATNFMDSLSGGEFSGVMQMADMFTGGALSQMAIFGLGIMPYITASIIFQLLVAIVPSLSRIAHEGATGRKKINQYVRVSTVLLCLIHGAMICGAMWKMNGNSPQAVFLLPGVERWEFFFYGMLALTAGTMFLMWLGEQIDEFGIGNGISLIIMAGILARLPVAIQKLANNFGAGGDASVGPGTLAVLLLMFVAMTLAVVMMTLGTRRVPVMQSKAMRGRMMVGGQRQAIPLKVNQANVIPIIFAQAILQVFALATQWSPTLGPLFAPNSFLYNLLYIAMIIFFCYFYTAIQFNPNEMADNLKQSGMYVPGIRPGMQTAKHLERIMTRVALAGGVFLAAVAIIPSIVSSLMGVDYDIAGMLGGTGLLIVVGVALDVVQRIESYLLMRNYEGFGMAGGRVRGRRG